MSIIPEKTKIQDLVRSMSILYDKFLTNRQYKDRQFKDNEEQYLKEQKALAEDIKLQETLVSRTIEKLFKHFFPHLEFIAYDSRTLYFNHAEARIGTILIKNMKDEDEVIIKNFFKENFLMEIIITKFEDLPEKLQEKFKK